MHILIFLFDSLPLAFRRSSTLFDISGHESKGCPAISRGKSVIQGRYIRAVAAHGLEEIVASAGGDIKAVAERAGFPLRALQNMDMLIPHRAVLALIERCAFELQIQDFGLLFTTRMEPHHLQAGPLMAVARVNHVVRDWLADALSYWAWHTNAFTMEVVEEFAPGRSLIRVKQLDDLIWARHFTEHVLANIVSMVRHATGRTSEDAELIRFRHSKPLDTASHQAFFRCPVEFGCEHNEIVFRSEILDYKTGHLLTPLRGIVRRYVQSRIDRMEFCEAGMTTNVKLAITSLMGTGQTDIASIADALDVHPKRLQRLLLQEGVSFSKVLEDVRKEMGTTMMASSPVPVGQVAGLLGYAGNAPFTKAFRKWTGTTPLAWRRKSADETRPQSEGDV